VTAAAPSFDPALQCLQLRLVAIHLREHHEQSLKALAAIDGSAFSQPFLAGSIA
jgi:hypothetical protein